ncbi:MAG: TetR family transcriptional regulator [Actinomycetota bacterium]|nr:TetR family transcriptional regulator [Actinomycetota bacterium]
MTNLVDCVSSPRGARRREQLLDAGLELLAEGGWPAVTARAIAQHSGSNVGLIHYHFSGMGPLRVAIARRAGDMVLAPMAAQLVRALDPEATVDAARELLADAPADRRTAALASELVTGAVRDPSLAAVIAEQLRDVRRQVAERLSQIHPDWTPERGAAVATLAAALLDGLILHKLLDAELPVEPALTALGDLVTALQGDGP